MSQPRTAELVTALVRLLVGVTKESAFDCEWYEGLEGDAIEEARCLIAKIDGEG